MREEEKILDITESSAKETDAEVTQDTEEEIAEEGAGVSGESSAEATEPPVTEGEANAGDHNTINPDFKVAMDSYEEFFDEYVEIMKKLEEDPSDISVLANYAKHKGRYAEIMQKFEDWESEDLNAAETAYYVDVQARIIKKLLEVA